MNGLLAAVFIRISSLLFAICIGQGERGWQGNTSRRCARVMSDYYYYSNKLPLTWLSAGEKVNGDG